MNSLGGEKAHSGGKNKSFFAEFLGKLRKRHIVETLAAFIGGGWLLIEVVERLLVTHYRFPDKTIDLTVVSIIGALLSTLIWRWFRGVEKRPGNVKVEVLLVPLIILATIAIDLDLVFDIAGVSGMKLLTGIIALCLGIAWIIFKSLQWAAIAPALSPELGKRQIELSPPAAAKPEKSIVVLPFADLSPQKDQEYFCDGMTEEIITDLSHINELRVISRNSAMMLKGTPKDTRTIGRELNVRYVLEGSVRKAGSDLRIAAQLIDAVTDAHIWAEKYPGTMDDVFDIQEKVSRSIVDALKLKLTPSENRRLAERPIDNAAAYECYLRAKHEIMLFTEDGLGRAITYLQNGLDIIGQNAVLFAGLGYAYFQYVNLGIQQEEYFQKAINYADMAFELDPESAPAHVLAGLINAIQGDLYEAIRHLKIAFSRAPNDVDVLLWLGWFLGVAGNFSAATPLVGKVLDLDPINPLSHLFYGALAFIEGSFALAEERISRAFRMGPDLPMSQFWYAMSLAYNGHGEKAVSVLEQYVKSPPQDIWAQMSLFLKFALQREKEKIPPLLTPDFLKTTRRDAQYSYHIAAFYAFLGEKEEALDWLENAVNRDFINYPLLAEKDPFLAKLRGEERFRKLMERVKHEWEHFEA